MTMSREQAVEVLRGLAHAYFREDCGKAYAAIDVLSSPLVPLRQEVRSFALLMESALAKHDDDRGARGWADDGVADLFTRIEEEMNELHSEVHPASTSVKRRTRDEGRIVKEAVDVANFAMMIADVSGGLATIPEAPREQAWMREQAEAFQRIAKMMGRDPAVVDRTECDVDEMIRDVRVLATAILDADEMETPEGASLIISKARLHAASALNDLPAEAPRREEMVRPVAGEAAVDVVKLSAADVLCGAKMYGDGITGGGRVYVRVCGLRIHPHHMAQDEGRRVMDPEEIAAGWWALSRSMPSISFTERCIAEITTLRSRVAELEAERNEWLRRYAESNTCLGETLLAGQRATQRANAAESEHAVFAAALQDAIRDRDAAVSRAEEAEHKLAVLIDANAKLSGTCWDERHHRVIAAARASRDMRARIGAIADAGGFETEVGERHAADAGEAMEDCDDALDRSLRALDTPPLQTPGKVT